MFRARKELVEHLKAELDVTKGVLTIREEALAGSRQMARALQVEANALRAQLEQLRGEKHDLEIQAAVLKERLDLLANHGIGEPSRLTGPTAMPEEAEDALFAFRAGHISKPDLEGILRQSGYDNAEVEFELSDYPHFAATQ